MDGRNRDEHRFVEPCSICDFMNLQYGSPAERKQPAKRICMIAYTRYPTDGRVRLEAESLVGWGHNVFFLVPKEGAISKTYQLHGVTIMELGARKYGGKSQFRYLLSYVAFLALASVACIRLFLQSRLNIIHVHNMPDILVFAGLLPRLFGCKLILDVHDTVPETYVAKFKTSSRLLLAILRLEERICCSLAHRVICVNHVQRDVLIERGIPKDKITTVVTMPNFVSRKQIANNHRDGQIFRMVNHGTISNRLGIDLIVQAAAKLVHAIPGFELHLYGEGDDLEEVMRMTEALGLSDHVHIHGVVPWESIPRELQTMDVGIVANRVNVATELMLPSKLIDYVVLDIPAIVPKLKAIQYYFSPDMVSYFEPENVESMVAATIDLYRDKVRREQQPNIAKRFLDKYGWENQQAGLKDLYKSLN
jgi:glycosyltransferase involved in cell wall biosynthesis